MKTIIFPRYPELKKLMDTKININGRKRTYKDFLFHKNISTLNEKSVMDRVFEESNRKNKNLNLSQRIIFHTNQVIYEIYFDNNPEEE